MTGWVWADSLPITVEHWSKDHRQQQQGFSVNKRLTPVGRRSKVTLLSRRNVLSGGAFALVAAPSHAAAPGPTSGQYLSTSGKNTAAPARASAISHEILEVGPGKKYRTLTEAGCFMNSIPRWNNGYTDPATIERMGFRIIISPGPPGYYTNDSGSHSRRWPSLVGWPPYEGMLLGPVIIEGEAGKPAPVLDTDGSGDGVLYYQTGLFATGSCDATFRHLIFRGFRRHDDIGNYAAVRLGQTFAKIPMNSHVLFEDCEFSGCDTGIMGGAVGQSLTLRRCYFHDNGNDTGRVHNIYFSDGDTLTVEDTLSTRCKIGHLLKTRAAKTIIRNTRLIGNGGTESACLDVPDGGILDIDGLVCEKSPGTDAHWVIHYSGENQDAAGVPFHIPSGITIRDLTMVAPQTMLRRPGFNSFIGFANQSGLGAASSGKGSYMVTPKTDGVKVYGLSERSAGLPCTVLQTKPLLDLRSPVHNT
ncbi:MAG: right-handed parallel beta-helix repeat-containing protein [Alphaproteobacteria bacterium]|nr:right-handed parallel beta-helix repeat-containing protein [Alphaproteobacteria bacterium]